MTTLTEFLLARIAEDEKGARAATTIGLHQVEHLGDGKWGREYVKPLAVELVRREVAWWIPAGPSSPGNQGSDAAGTALFERFAPARVLAECEAKRRLVALHGPDQPYCSDNFSNADHAYFEGPCENLRILALPYADHPEFRSEWRP